MAVYVILNFDKFPTEEELIARYKQEIHQGSGLTQAEETIINQPYYSSHTTYPPRYYQRIAINRTVDAIARGQQRLLLVMATGTGKTQQLAGDDDKEHFSELFTPDFFDLIIVDECHRGSAKEESRWRRILDYFSGAGLLLDIDFRGTYCIPVVFCQKICYLKFVVHPALEWISVPM